MEENSGSSVPLSFHAPAKSRRASSTSSASSSASSSAGHHHRKNRRRNRRNDKRMKRLEKAVDNLTATVSTIVKGQSIHSVPKMHENSDSDALSILVPDDSEASFSHDKTEGSQPVLRSFDFKQETTLKSTIPKISTSHAETLCKLQHFDTIDWSRVRVTEQDKAVLQLKQQRDKLKQYQKKIELNLERDRQLAKKLLAEGKRDRAKLLLKKKRYQEQLLGNTDAQLEKLEQLTHDLEFTQIELQVLEGLKTGNVALKKVHDILNIDEIEKILDETKEGIEKQREIDELISGHLTTEDDEAIEAELESILDISNQLPDIPTDKLPGIQTEETPVKLQRVKDKPSKIAIEA
ncbi:unnamed protein product, partial [Iphiclides podalirius]